MGLKRHSYSSYRATLLIIFGQHHNNNIIIILPIILLSVLRRHIISLFKSPCLSNGVVNVCVAAVAGVAMILYMYTCECVVSVYHTYMAWDFDSLQSLTLASEVFMHAFQAAGWDNVIAPIQFIIVVSSKILSRLWAYFYSWTYIIILTVWWS